LEEWSQYHLRKQMGQRRIWSKSIDFIPPAYADGTDNEDTAGTDIVRRRL